MLCEVTFANPPLLEASTVDQDCQARKAITPSPAPYAHAGSGYRLRGWEGPSPQAWRTPSRSQNLLVLIPLA